MTMAPCHHHHQESWNHMTVPYIDWRSALPAKSLNARKQSALALANAWFLLHQTTTCQIAAILRGASHDEHY